MIQHPVTDVSITYNVALITVGNLPKDVNLVSRIYAAIGNEGINIDMISLEPPFRGEVYTSFTLPDEDLVKAIRVLNNFKKEVSNLRIEVDAHNTKLSVYGEAMKNIPGVAARVFTRLAAEGIELKLVTTSEVDISCLIYDKDADRAVFAIKQEFGL